MTDIHDLNRFLPRQDTTHAQALAELRAGRKVTHWIWWEMPQLRSLGRSQRAHDFGIANLDEACRYMNHPVLATRLIELCQAMLQHSDRPAEDILGPVDALKVRSTATLFSAVPSAHVIFQQLLDSFYDGQRCARTDAEIDLFTAPES